MPTNARTPEEQAFWDAVFLQQLPDCTRSQKQRGPQYCAHVAREYADAALTERRRSRLEDQQ